MILIWYVRRSESREETTDEQDRSNERCGIPDNDRNTGCDNISAVREITIDQSIDEAEITGEITIDH